VVCNSVDDLVSLLAAWGWPAPSLGVWVALVVAFAFWAIETGLRYSYGGVPDGVLGALGTVAIAVAILIYAGGWTNPCGQIISVSGFILLGIAVLVGAIVLWFWHAHHRLPTTVLRSDAPPDASGR